MERLKIGINGLDDTIGGFPMGRSVLITGEPGCGKTIFGLRFAISSCMEGYNTVYITAEEDANDLHIQANSFGWNTQELEEKGLLNFIELTGIRARITEAELSMDMDPMKGNFTKIIHDIPPEAEVVVIDSLGGYTAKLTAYEFRNQFDLLVYELKQRGITSVIILDSATSKEFNELALFSVYGAIKLGRRENPYTGRRERIMDIVKMRSTKTPLQFLTYEIGGEEGITITEGEEIPEDDMGI
ncbi:MAG TPA: ATPase domain-containing protein [Methanothermobacter thermautotrophicus]|nr:ATPase domain-containing protein [Methanothermobacter thermautotrophicus]